MDKSEQFQVLITRSNEKFRARSPHFPRCFGLGVSREEALHKLSESIARFIGKQAKASFSNLLSSDRYTEILLDPAKKDSDEHLVFGMPTGHQKQVNIRLRPTALLGAGGDQVGGHVRDQLAAVLGLNDGQLLKSLENMFSDGFPPSEEGYVFGFPLSLN